MPLISNSSASSIVGALPTAPAPTPSSPPSGPLSVGLAIGLVLCPIAFIFITLAFWRVARRGDVCVRLPTARMREEEEQQHRDYNKYMERTRAGGSSSPLPLPQYTPHTPSAPPQAFMREPGLPPYE